MRQIIVIKSSSQAMRRPEQNKCVSISTSHKNPHIIFCLKRKEEKYEMIATQKTTDHQIFDNLFKKQNRRKEK